MFDFNEIQEERSYSPLKPGEKVEVVLEKVEVSEQGDLDFFFRGTAMDNAGSFKQRFWANNFDKSDARYTDDAASNFMRQIHQIVTSYVPSEKARLIKGNSWAEVVNSIMQILTPDTYKDVPTFLKVVYKYNSDENVQIPRYREFISTELKPRALKLSIATNDAGIPYDRVLPLSEYGASGTTNSPSGDEGLPFGGEEEIPAFGEA